jgi:hypothetical protein
MGRYNRLGLNVKVTFSANITIVKCCQDYTRNSLLVIFCQYYTNIPAILQKEYFVCNIQIQWGSEYWTRPFENGHLPVFEWFTSLDHFINRKGS